MKTALKIILCDFWRAEKCLEQFLNNQKNKNLYLRKLVIKC